MDNKVEISLEEYEKLKAAEQTLIDRRSRKNEQTKRRLRELKCISIRTEIEFSERLKNYCDQSGISIRQTILTAIEEFTNNEVSARKA